MTRPTFLNFHPAVSGDTTPLPLEPPCYCIGTEARCARCKRRRFKDRALLLLIVTFTPPFFAFFVFAMKLCAQDATKSFKAEDPNRGAVDVVAFIFLLILTIVYLWSTARVCVLTFQRLRPQSDVARRIGQLGLFREQPAQPTRTGLPKFTP